MSCKQIFWLHIRKSAGMTTRNLLQPYYLEVVDRVNKPKTFIQVSPDEYNDILNNYRVVLGDYQFRRCQFAKKYLYPDQWDNIFSFAFSREPIDRCLSMFYYLYWQDKTVFKQLENAIKKSLNSAKLHYCTSYAFDVFLDNVHEALVNDSIYSPLGIHFSTHVAPMWSDITDSEGNILLKKVYRLENLIDGINQVYEECGLDKKIERSNKKINKNKNRGNYKPTKSQIQKIESIYTHDFEIYENAGIL